MPSNSALQRLDDLRFLEPLGALVAEVVQLGPANFRLLGGLDFGDERRVQRENTFHADAFTDFADGHGRRDTRAAFAGEHDAFKDLNPLFFAFFDLLVHAHSHARADVRQVGFEVGLANGPCDVHKKIGVNAQLW